MESWYYQYKLQAPLEDNNTILQPKKKKNKGMSTPLFF